jgi:hypothetical protein
MARTFTSSAAVRTRVPVWLALCGPSGTGKTFSALRLATGMRKLDPGPIFGVDTESGRMKHYAPAAGERADGKKTFDFTHVPFDPPFGPQDYAGVLEYCAAQGARHVILDSGSHLHDGAGGILEMHAKEVQELAAKWKKTEDQVQASAWIEPKRQELVFIDVAKRLALNIIWCFRAEDKTDFKASRPKALGFMPIIGKKLLWEMTASCLLLPGKPGVPQWHPEEMGEKATIKLPLQFKDIFGARDQKLLDEETGGLIAQWAAGDVTPTPAPVPGKASAADLKVLIAMLTDGGVGTPDLRKAWIEARVGHPITTPNDLSAPECLTCTAAARAGV